MREDIKTSEVHITAIEQIKRSGFEKKFVQKVDVVDLAAGHINIGWNADGGGEKVVHFGGERWA